MNIEGVGIARLIGGAGTGKTTELLRIMEGALEYFNHDPMMLGFASFTRAARAEAVERASESWGVPPTLLTNKGWFRTVHSTVYKCLGITGSELLTGSRSDIEWISEQLGVRVTTEIDEYGNTKFIGDQTTAAALNCWHLSKATLTPAEEVVKALRAVDDNIPDFASVVRISERYETAKNMDGKADFSDILMRFAGLGMNPREGLYEKTPEGELPEVGAWLFDEQQDASPLLDRVCKRLVSAPSVRWAYVVGDPFQAIYGFAGSSASCFLNWDVQKEKTMPKSWRCPKIIHELGESCLRQMQGGYFDRGIASADHEGTLSVAHDIDEVVSILDPRESWLLIARTNHQASRLMASLFSSGKPARWTTSPEGMTNRANGLLALNKLENGEAITGKEWQRAVEVFPSNMKTPDGIKKGLLRGTKAKWKKNETVEEWDVIFPDELAKVGATEDMKSVVRSGDWVRYVDNGSSWRKQARDYGAELASDPKVRVGTIHSVKGAEADNVGLLTTISKRVANGRESRIEQHNEECRISYVGVTRARRTLHIINESKPLTPSMDIPV